MKDMFIKDNVLRLDTAKIVVIDEADMTLEFGFLEDIDEILSKMDKKVQMMVFSATIPESLQPFLKKYLYDPEFIEIKKEEAFQSDPQKAAKDVLSSDEEEFAVEIDSAQPIYWHTEDVNSDKFLLEVAVGKYVIEQGDCLSVLAERFNTSVEQLMADNQNIIDPDLIYTGDFIVVK